MAKQAKNTGRNWYAIHTYSGYEDAVEKALRQRIETLNMQEYIFDVMVPKEKQIVIKRGTPTEEEKRIFPGYVLVEMLVTDDSWYVVRNTPNVTGFVGSGNLPVPVTPEEFGNIKDRSGEGQAKFKIDFVAGDTVEITGGPFKSYNGVVDEVDVTHGKLKVLIDMFNRQTPVELDFTQVKKK